MAIQKIELSAALNSLATQTNIDKVTGMLGTSAANISKADLATVVADLTLIKKSISIGIDANDLSLGFYFYNSTNYTEGKNLPFDGGGFILCFECLASRKTQIAIDSYCTKMKVRTLWGNSWYGWKEL